jgi:hypothetical protein
MMTACDGVDEVHDHKHDCAVAGSASIVGKFIDLLREDEIPIAREEVYDELKILQGVYELSVVQSHLTPSNN